MIYGCGGQWKVELSRAVLRMAIGASSWGRSPQLWAGRNIGTRREEMKDNVDNQQLVP